MKQKPLLISLNYFIALVWLINGLVCKVLDLVPRHQEIVERILNIENARSLTLLIGIAETGMAIWILSNFWPRLNAIIQMIIIAVMNTLEFLLAPDLLLWGKANAAFALMFILLIYYKELHLRLICFGFQDI